MSPNIVHSMNGRVLESATHFSTRASLVAFAAALFSRARSVSMLCANVLHSSMRCETSHRRQHVIMNTNYGTRTARIAARCTFKASSNFFFLSSESSFQASRNLRIESGVDLGSWRFNTQSSASWSVWDTASGGETYVRSLGGACGVGRGSEGWDPRNDGLSCPIQSPPSDSQDPKACQRCACVVREST